MESLAGIILIIILSYLLGSIPSALIVSKRFFNMDIRQHGSGNMGSTNVFRVLGRKWGIVVQIADTLKGILAIYLVADVVFIYFSDADIFQNQSLVRIVAGLSAVLGHIFSIFANFKGGKGINTAAGMLLAISPPDFAITAGAFALTLSFSGIISLSSMVASCVLPISLFSRYTFFKAEIPDYHTLIYFFIFITLLIFYTHKANIKRLIAGNENRFENLRIIKLSKKSN